MTNKSDILYAKAFKKEMTYKEKPIEKVVSSTEERSVIIYEGKEEQVFNSEIKVIL